MLSDDQKKTIREFVDLVRSKNINVDLPEIAVCGDTSSGKSSLLSTLTLIELPASKDICTRNPTRIRTEHSKEASCVTRIHWDPEGPASQILKSQAHYSEEIQALSIANPCPREELTERISTLQEQVLRYDKRQDIPGRDVSYSVVEVDLKGPEFSNFTVIDLPGIVNTAGAADVSDIGSRIDALLDSYLRRARCILVAILPANVDFHNSQILKRALMFDPSTERTFPVLTKPDLVDRGSEDSIVHLVRGNATKEKFLLEFHMVKLRSQLDLNNKVSLQMAVDSEREFFRQSFYHGQIKHEHLGIPNLRQRLATLYMDHVMRNVPAVITELEAQQQAITKELEGLGPDTSTPSLRAELWRSLRNHLCNSVDRLTSSLAVGDGPRVTLRARLEVIKRDFSAALSPVDFGEYSVGCTVRYMVNGRSELFEVIAVKRKSGDMIECALCPCNPISSLLKAVSEDLESKADDKELATEDHCYYCFLNSKKLPSLWSRKTEGDITKGVPETHYWKPAKFISEEMLFPCYTSLEDEIKQNRQHVMELFEAEAVFNRHVRLWLDNVVSKACVELVSSIEAVVRPMVVNITTSRPEYQYRERLLDSVRSSLNTSVQSLIISLEDRLDQMKEDEYLPQTLNNYFNSNIRRMRHEPLKHALLSTANYSQVVSVADVKNILDEADHRPLTDFVAEEVSIYLRAYFKVARKTITDKVCMIVDSLLESTTSKPATTSMFAARTTREHTAQKKKTLLEFLDAALTEQIVDPNPLLVNPKIDILRSRLQKQLEDLKAAVKQIPQL